MLEEQSQFDRLESLCSIYRDEDNLYALDVELVLYKNITTIYRKSQDFELSNINITAHRHIPEEQKLSAEEEERYKSDAKKAALIEQPIVEKETVFANSLSKED